jgi:hypothetical protein
MPVLVEKLKWRMPRAERMSSGLFGTSQEGVDEMIYQLPLVVLTCSGNLTNMSVLSIEERERTDLLATIASSDEEVIQQDNDGHNEKEMNESASYMEGKPTK